MMGNTPCKRQLRMPISVLFIFFFCFFFKRFIRLTLDTVRMCNYTCSAMPYRQGTLSLFTALQAMMKLLFFTKMFYQFNILRHDGDTLGMNRTQVCVLEEVYEIHFCCFLQGAECLWLKSKILATHFMGNFTNQPAKGQQKSKWSPAV